ncbi:MAG: 3-oxoacyl-ACP reductase FabG [Candidatus Zixiibacteriota bacterium]
MAEDQIQNKRIAIVTGGAKGIGAAITRRLVADGCRVAVVGRDHAALKAMCDHIQSNGGEGLAVATDLADPASADSICAQVEDHWGPATILVNNAGVTRDNLLIRMGTEDFTDVLNINLTAAFALSKRCTRPMMKARWGRIINISSIVAVMGNAGQANYIASKAGLIGLTRALAQELASRNITVNAVAPGFIETEMTASLPEEVQAKYKERIPLSRFGTAEDVAEVVGFLASDRAAYITGQTLHVDGGMVMS